jgi:hypothetical protein
MDLVKDESDFMNKWSTVAEPIYRYLETVPRGVLGFDEARINWPRSASARFSCVADDGWHRRIVTVSAVRAKDDEDWQLKHTEELSASRPPPPKGTRYFLE